MHGLTSETVGKPGLPGWSRLGLPYVLWAILLLGLALRLLGAWHAHLTFDERAHLALAETIRWDADGPRLVWRSLDHPPLSIYLMRLSGVLFGPSDLGLRLLHVLSGTATLCAVYMLGRRVYCERAGLWAAALLAVDPFHVTWSRVFMPEAPMLLFATLAMLQMLRAAERERLGDYLLLGLLLGLAYLAKETALLLWPALWVYVLLSPGRRAILSKPGWYAAHGAFLVVVAPDVAWNLLHFHEGYVFRNLAMADGPPGFSLKAASLYLGEVFRAAVGPDALDSAYVEGNLRVCHWPAGVFYLVAVAVAAVAGRREASVRLLTAVFLVVFLAISLAPSGEMFDPFWWASITLIPAVVCAGWLAARAARASRWLLAAGVVALGYLTVHCAIEVTYAGPRHDRADVRSFADDFLRRAEGAMRRGDLVEARNRYLFVVNIAGPDAEAYYGLARVAWRRDRPETARAMLEKCLELHADHPEALDLLARLPPPRPDFHPMRAAVAAMVASVFLFAVPGVLGWLAMRRFAATRAVAPAWSLFVNTAALVALCAALRATAGIDRTTLGAAWALWIAVLVAAAWRGGEGWKDLGRAVRAHGAGLLVGLAAAAGAVVVFFPEQFVQCFSEDGTETFELAQSLGKHFLPHWELETWDPIPGGRVGPVVVNPSLVNSYWTFGLQTLAGPTEAATRLPYWAWSLAAFAVAWRMVRRPDGEGDLPRAVVLAMGLWLTAVWFTFYVGYNPYMADLANPGVPDAAFALLALLCLDSLRRGDRWGVILSGVMATLVLYPGVLWLGGLLLGAWLWQPERRRETLGTAWRAAAILAGVAVFYLFYGWRAGALPYWIDTLDIEYVNDYLAAAPRWQSVPLFAGYFVLGCGVAPAAALLVALRGEPWQRAAATATLLYLAVVLGSGFKNLHYLAPLLPFPVVLCLTGHAGRRGTEATWRIAAALGFLAATALCWPAQRQTFTLNRELGEMTTIGTESYIEAVQWARIRHTLRAEGIMSWDCDEYTWVAYSRLARGLPSPPGGGAGGEGLLNVPRAVEDHDRPYVLVGGPAWTRGLNGGPAWTPEPGGGRRVDAAAQRNPEIPKSRNPRIPHPSPLAPRPSPLPSPSSLERYVLVASRELPYGGASAWLYARDRAWGEALSGPSPLRPRERYPWVFQPLAEGRFSPHNNRLEDIRRLR